MMPTTAVGVGAGVVDVAAVLMIVREGWVIELGAAVSLAVLVLLRYAVVPYAGGLIASLSGLHAAFPGDDATAPSAVSSSGLDGTSISRLPCFEVVRRGKGWSDDDIGTATAAAECVVCLDDVEEGQTVRALPCCRTAFHARCVDAWLRLRPTCPVCRATLR